MSKVTSIAGYKFEISTPYAEGATINAAEAAVLNQTRAENIGNNLRSKFKEAIEAQGEEGLSEEQVKKLQAKVAEYDAAYKLEAKKPATPKVTDPVEKEARKLAREAINFALKAKNVKRKDLDEAQATKLAEKEEELSVRGGKIWKQAEANVKKTQEATSGILDDLGLAAAE